MAVFAAGLHATIAGVLAAIAIPLDPSHRRGFLGRVLHPAPRGRAEPRPGLAKNFEEATAPWVTFMVLPLFALANAGVDVEMPSRGSLPLVAGIAAGLVLGKPLGVIGFALLAERFPWASAPAGVKTRHLVALGLLSGIGFTMSIFFLELAVPEEQRGPGTLAVLVSSLLVGLLGFAALLIATRRPAPSG